MLIVMWSEKSIDAKEAVESLLEGGKSLLALFLVSSLSKSSSVCLGMKLLFRKWMWVGYLKYDADVRIPSRIVQYNWRSTKRVMGIEQPKNT